MAVFRCGTLPFPLVQSYPTYLTEIMTPATSISGSNSGLQIVQNYGPITAHFHSPAGLSWKSHATGIRTNCIFLFQSNLKHQQTKRVYGIYRLPILVTTNIVSRRIGVDYSKTHTPGSLTILTSNDGSVSNKVNCSGLRVTLGRVKQCFVWHHRWTD